jgi:hypothetical protein
LWGPKSRFIPVQKGKDQFYFLPTLCNTSERTLGFSRSFGRLLPLKRDDHGAKNAQGRTESPMYIDSQRCTPSQGRQCRSRTSTQALHRPTLARGSAGPILYQAIWNAFRPRDPHVSCLIQPLPLFPYCKADMGHKNTLHLAVSKREPYSVVSTCPSSTNLNPRRRLITSTNNKPLHSLSLARDIHPHRTPHQPLTLHAPTPLRSSSPWNY